MKYLIDENLPPALADFIRGSGSEARHVNEFADEQPVSDQAIRRFALCQEWVVVSRDDDFVKSYISRKAPEKLIYVFGFDKKQEILNAFRSNWSELSGLIMEHELIELNPRGLQVHF